MKTICWNVRGMGNPQTVRNLKHEVQKSSPQIVFIFKTKCNEDRAEFVKRVLGFDNCFAVSSNGQSGGLALFWNNESSVNISSFSLGHIDTTVKSNSGTWRFTRIYGNPESSKRRDSWELIKRLGQGAPLLWLIGEISTKSLTILKKRGRGTRNQRQMDEFNEMMDFCNLADLGFSGNIFTWRRGRKQGSWIRERLNRFLTNVDMLHLFRRL